MRTMKKRFLVLLGMVVVSLGVTAAAPAAHADECWPYRHYSSYGHSGRHGYFSYDSCDEPFYRWTPRRGLFVSFVSMYLPAPQVLVQPAAYTVAAVPTTMVVNVPNRNGSYTPVKLQVAGNGTYIGPQGEVYPTQPTMEQLKEMYGQ